MEKKRFHATETLPTFQFLLKQYDDIFPPPEIKRNVSRYVYHKQYI